MKFFAILVLFAAAACAEFTDEDHAAWKSFKMKHKKMFLSVNKEKQRMKNFLRHKKSIDEINEAHAKGESTYKAAVYSFHDLSVEEFLTRYTGAIVNETNVRVTKIPTLRQTPTSYDARTLGGVNEVKNQQQCGSCWTFSATASVENAVWRATGQMDTLAEQQLVDCVYPRSGCNGGFMDAAFDYIIKQQGQQPETAYPYQAVYGSCQTMTNGPGTMKSYIWVDQDQAQIQSALVQYQVLAIAVDASQWNSYSSGVFKATSVGQINHAVNLIGYGNCPETGEDYWLVRNSWGADWGENGYIRLSTSDLGTYQPRYTLAVTG